ncbi:uncharacterized protein YktA (UPF0223 family) [Geomicrobium halophilum]|uniref:Uncharacterized protein YktA (UPF0223 family) n=1 Tax=Geomicrobium halophilum TaxID=549000 RepID=A0A841PL12_9BACL|nr:UPF0223 family protein [Geomicrobium halophilum]MBB6449439.1 uncharacterized protein YktA (UPF0223 family) [Geomicrobium halophilum]
MKDHVSLPFSMDWTKEEIVKVVNFFTQVDDAYDKGTRAGTILKAYEEFKEVVPAKNEEKTYFRDYERQTNQSCWQTVQQARKVNEDELVRRP